MPLRGERLDKPSYSHLRSLSGGVTGEAWVSDHDVYDIKVVQKRYSTIGMEDAAAVREPQLLQRIRHPNVIRVLEAQWDPELQNAITFVTPYCKGKCIAKALEEDYRFSVSQALGLTIQLLEALAYAHHDSSLRIIHRDVKPGNAFLDEHRRTLYLGDWGSAATMDAAGQVAGIEGTLLYMAPEAGPPDGRIGITADIYGAGMTLYEMLCGALPYESMDPVKLDRRVTRGLPALPPAALTLAPHLSPVLRRIVRKATAPKPDVRYERASVFITALRRYSGIDWRHAEGRDLDGEWDGTWPPHLREERRRRYRVRSYVLSSGPHRGKRRLEAYQANSPAGASARFGVDDVTLHADDREGVERFFAAVEARAAHLVPARR
jgi:serine/threonine protein kinase